MPQYDNLFDPTRQPVMVVGDAGGIGGEIASTCAQFGARISIAGRKRERAVAAQQLGLDDGRSMGMRMDVTQAASIRTGLDQAEARSWSTASAGR